MHSGSAVPAPVERGKSSPERFVVIQSRAEWYLAVSWGWAAAQSITHPAGKDLDAAANLQWNQRQKCCDCAEQVKVMAREGAVAEPCEGWDSPSP